MGEATPTPEVAAKVMQDLTAVEVDPDKGERLYKAALIRSKQGSTYRMLAKSLKSGKLDIVHYGCDLDAEGKPTTKWAIRRIPSESTTWAAGICTTTAGLGRTCTRSPMSSTTSS